MTICLALAIQVIPFALFDFILYARIPLALLNFLDLEIQAANFLFNVPKLLNGMLSVSCI